ncbi:MAG: hypothetical protein HQM16_19595 [Deltaproteobacteria bacterium]|nr:hypothetical protein [Deltaproteobacteria bacterium]
MNRILMPQVSVGYFRTEVNNVRSSPSTQDQRMLDDLDALTDSMVQAGQWPVPVARPAFKPSGIPCIGPVSPSFFEPTQAGIATCIGPVSGRIEYLRWWNNRFVPGVDEFGIGGISESVTPGFRTRGQIRVRIHAANLEMGRGTIEGNARALFLLKDTLKLLPGHYSDAHAAVTSAIADLHDIVYFLISAERQRNNIIPGIAKTYGGLFDMLGRDVSMHETAASAWLYVDGALTSTGERIKTGIERQAAILINAAFDLFQSASGRHLGELISIVKKIDEVIARLGEISRSGIIPDGQNYVPRDKKAIAKQEQLFDVCMLAASISIGAAYLGYIATGIRDEISRHALGAMLMWTSATVHADKAREIACGLPLRAARFKPAEQTQHLLANRLYGSARISFARDQ